MIRLSDLNEEVQKHLIEAARLFDSMIDYINDIGLEDWMEEYIEGEELTEQEVTAIDKVLEEAYRKAWTEDTMIPLGEWAKINGIDPATARQRAERGALRTAQKIGRNWVISSEEELIDYRKKENKKMYILIDVVDGDMFTKEFDNLKEAMRVSENEWEHLSDHDKKRREAFYLLESANPDEDAENHFDGDVVREWK